ncbi:MAG: hypothetical protein KBT11_04305 [Treponema sp.]|nr:hypothetical protein [Candidatus Treponema equifaecale]
MKKFLLLALACFMVLGCSAIKEDNSSNKVTITINSANGKTVMDVDAESKVIMRSVHTAAETETVTERKYSYDSNQSLRSVEVSDSDSGRYVIKYGETQDNSGRSVMEQQTDIPRKVQKISREYSAYSRNTIPSLTNKEPDTVEYYYDENGKLAGIFRVDDKNNVFYKGAN